MNECTKGELRDLLPELVNGRLDAATRQRVEAHVASCTECADELALLRSLRPVLMRGPAIDARRIAAAVRAQTAGGVNRVPARAGSAARWRVAIAAAALFAMSALGYAVIAHRAPGAPVVAVAPAPMPAAPQQTAITPPHVAVPANAPALVASSGALDNLSDLSDDDVRTLTASLDELSPIPNADPSPGIDPLGASLDDPSGGGS